MGNNSSENESNDSGDLERNALLRERVMECSEKLRAAQEEIGKAVWGQEEVVKLTMACMVAKGHMLGLGVPGVGKTHLVKCLSRVMGLDSQRIQFTPDLMPSDILGSEVLKEDENGDQHFELQQGPIFSQFILADEINRTGPKTQAALLEAMGERTATIAGDTYLLPDPFVVLATQNPLEQEGTYPLPEAQLDRFMMRLDFGYPDADSEEKVMTMTTGGEGDVTDKGKARKHAIKKSDTDSADSGLENKLVAVLGVDDLADIQGVAEKLPLSHEFLQAVKGLVRGLRPEDETATDEVKELISCGPGPRASQAFIRAARARALMEGRCAPDISDIKALAVPILEHRLILNFAAEAEGRTAKEIIKKKIEELKL